MDQAKRDQMYYIMRRLHSLTGILPIGAFLIQHMYGNVLSLWGPEVYDHHVHFILEQPLLPLLEWGGIFIPLALHAILGLLYTFNADMNPRQLLSYGYGRNRAYWMQRFTGIIALVYIVLHVAGTRFSFDEGEKANMYASMVTYFEQSPFLIWVYIIGVVAACYHLCNGIWSFCIMWGITITRKSQDMVFKASLGLFVVLSIMGILSALQLGGMLNDNPEKGVFENPHKKIEIASIMDRSERALAAGEDYLADAQSEELDSALESMLIARDNLQFTYEDAAATSADLDVAVKELDAAISRVKALMTDLTR